MPNTSNRELDCSRRVAVISTFLIMVIITIYQLNKNNVVTQSIESSQRIGYERVTDNVVMQSIESSQRIGYDRAPKEEEEEGKSRCNFQSVHLL